MIRYINCVIFLLFAALAFSQRWSLIDEFCAIEGIQCPPVHLNAFGQYDVVSFNNINMNTGDIQGRAATRNDFNAPSAGVSVGDQLHMDNGDMHLSYTLIAGGNVVWSDGTVLPLDSGIMVGGSFDGSIQIRGQIHDYCDHYGCLDDYFDNAFDYWTQFSETLFSFFTNVEISVEYGMARLTCDNDDILYSIDIDVELFSTITGYEAIGCNGDAIWLINIVGNSSPVIFNGTPFNGQIFYNIVDDAMILSQTQVNGNIIAPRSTLNQVGGTISGYVIVGDVENILQINRPIIPTGGVITRLIE